MKSQLCSKIAALGENYERHVLEIICPRVAGRGWDDSEWNERTGAASVDIVSFSGDAICRCHRGEIRMVGFYDDFPQKILYKLCLK